MATVVILIVFLGLARSKQVALDLCTVCECRISSFVPASIDSLDCSGKNFSRIPLELRESTYSGVQLLDLSNNFLEQIDSFAFAGKKKLNTLVLSGNNIRIIKDRGFDGLQKLRVLSLAKNELTEIPSLAISTLGSLRLLNLEGNKIFRVRDRAFQSLPKLESLLLSGNLIKNISRHAFSNLARLQVLDLSSNLLTSVPTLSLQILPKLRSLDLNLNGISRISDSSFDGVWAAYVSVQLQRMNSTVMVSKAAFRGMPMVRKLSFSPGQLSEFPDLTGSDELQYLEVSGIQELVVPDDFCSSKLKLKELSILHSKMTTFPMLRGCLGLESLQLAEVVLNVIPDSVLSGLPNLKEIKLLLRKEEVKFVGLNAFSNLPALKRLDLSDIKLSGFPNLTGTSKLEEIKLDQCSLRYIPNNLCDVRGSYLRSLKLTMNMLQEMPNLSRCYELRHVELEHNSITDIDGKLSGLRQLIFLRLSYNNIRTIGSSAFRGTSALADLFLDNNVIEYIHPDAFQDCVALTELDVSHNHLKKFPSKGLTAVLVINARHNPDMITFATQEDLPHVRKLTLDYAYHCCYFKHKVEQIQASYDLNMEAHKLDSWRYRLLTEMNQNLVNPWKHINYSNIPVLSSQELEPLLRDMNNHTEIYFQRPAAYQSQELDEVSSMFHDTSGDGVAFCSPTPNDFYPCEDLMGRQWLRICAWVVFLLALLGNLTVLFILTANCSKLDVPRYLIINLAIADLCLGIYLGFLTFVDFQTLGDFRAHALQWQFSGSCKAAGFLAIFASELSVYTLSAITVERYITIKYSIYTLKRMTKKHAAIVMSIGWIFSLIIAALPLYEGGVKFNDYTKYSVCLPFDSEGTASKVYLIFILLFNLIAFSVIFACYVNLYLRIRGSNAWNSGDSRAARRMALLVVTDFICWFPIALVALSAVFKNSLITDLWVSKVFTIFVFPLNACANPFLYTICSRQFRKDCMAIARQVRETSSRHRGLTKSLMRLPLKGSLTYSTSVRRGSSCSFLFGRRSSSRNDDVRATSRAANISIKTPLNTDDEPQNQDESSDYNEVLTSL